MNLLVVGNCLPNLKYFLTKKYENGRADLNKYFFKKKSACFASFLHVVLLFCFYENRCASCFSKLASRGFLTTNLASRVFLLQRSSREFLITKLALRALKNTKLASRAFSLLLNTKLATRSFLLFLYHSLFLYKLYQVTRVLL